MEFEAEATGTTATCPQCGQLTELLLTLPPAAGSSIRTKAIVFTVIALVILLAGLGGALWALKRAQRISSRQQAVSSEAGQPLPPNAVDSFASSGFRVSLVALEKGEGSSIVHAVGTIANTTSRQRFGVRVELELLDANGKKVGNATDYRATLEPRVEWRFRALVVAKNAVAARVGAIKEDQ